MDPEEGITGDGMGKSPASPVSEHVSSGGQQAICLFFNCIYSKGDADVKNRLLDSVGAEEGEMI